MKRFFLVLSLLPSLICSFAAINQPGYVKTRGRLDNNGQVIPGSRLSSATVVLKNGSSVISDENGNFNLSLQSNKFFLKDVKKTGYIVSDPDMLSKQYAYSQNPLILVLDEPDAQLEDKLASERKLHRNLLKQLQQREEELDALKEDSRISKEQYSEAMQKLYAELKSNEEFVSKMAERYSKIDFDQLDDFQRQFATFIQNGELVRADSLLRTKGSMDEREAELMRLRDANAKERKELSSREENLSKSEKNEAILLADFGADCYNHFELCKLKFDNDSAAYWLERRANADTTNGLWQREFGKFLYINMADYNKSRYYFQRALNLALEQNGEKSEEAAVCLSNLGNIEEHSGNYEKALKFYDSAIELDSLLYGGESYAVSLNYNNKACVFDAIGDYFSAIEYYKKVISLLETDSKSNQQLLADAYSNLAGVYSNMERLTEAIELSKRALDIRLKLFDENVSPDIAVSYSNLGLLLGKTGDNEKGLEYLFKANDIYSKIYKENHPSIASVYNNIGTLLDNEPQDAIEYYNKALSIRKSIFGNDSHLCAIVYNNIGDAYFHLREYSKAIPYFETALNIYKNCLGGNHPQIAIFYSNIATAYDSANKINEAIENYLEAAKIYNHNYGDESDGLSYCYYSVGGLYLYKREFSEALEYTNKATNIRANLYGINSAETMRSIAQEGVIYNHMGKYHESYDKLLSAYKFFTSEEGLDEFRAAQLNNYIYMSIIDGVKENVVPCDMLNDYLRYNIIAIYIDPGETPAREQGLEGEYYLLQFDSWNIESLEKLYDRTNALNGKPKTITLMKDGKITKHYFEDKIGCRYLIKKIDPEEKVRIIENFHQWRTQNI